MAQSDRAVGSPASSLPFWINDLTSDLSRGFRGNAPSPA